MNGQPSLEVKQEPVMRRVVVLAVLIGIGALSIAVSGQAQGC
jgi:hypothetical protein